MIHLFYLFGNSIHLHFITCRDNFHFKMLNRGTYGVLESFKIHIQRAKIERQRVQRLANVELDDTLDHYI